MAAPASFRWTFPGAPIRIDLTLALAERLKREVLRARGEETGGILLGEIESDCVRITDFEPFPHQGGPLYSLDLAARGAFAETVWGKQQAVGYYRSHLRDGLALDDADLALIRTCFADPRNVVLLMRPEPHGEVTAGFFFWDEGRIHPDFSFLEFPLDPAELRDDPPRPRRPGRMRRFLPIAAAALVLLAPGVWLARQFWIPGPIDPPPAPEPALGLRAELRGREVTILWDLSPATLLAARARLSVRDGGVQRQFVLTPEQVRLGAFRYVPRGQNLHFRLDVAGVDGKTASQNVLVLAPARAAPLRDTLE
jgi:hypothetical protein